MENFQLYHGVPDVSFTVVGASVVWNTNAIPYQNKCSSLSIYCKTLFMGYSIELVVLHFRRNILKMPVAVVVGQECHNLLAVSNHMFLRG